MKIIISIFCVLVMGCSPQPEQSRDEAIYPQALTNTKDSSKKQNNLITEIPPDEELTKTYTFQNMSLYYYKHTSERSIVEDINFNAATFRIAMHSMRSGDTNFNFRYRLRIYDKKSYTNTEFYIYAKFNTSTYNPEKLIQRFILQHNQPPRDSMCYSINNNSAVLPFKHESPDYISQYYCPDGYVLVEKNIKNWSDTEYMALMFFWNLQRELLQPQLTTPR